MVKIISCYQFGTNCPSNINSKIYSLIKLIRFKEKFYPIEGDGQNLCPGEFIEKQSPS